MTILNGGNVGIGSSVPTEKLDVDGNIKVTGSLNSITNEQLDYLAGVTSSVQTQLDTTDTKIDTLDSNMSNYLSETDTAINTRVTTLDSNMSNYLSETDTAINTRVTTLDSNMSNYLSETDTAINTRVTTLDSNMSNYLSETDTAINTRVTTLDSNMSNYLSETDTAINTRVTTLDSNMSNYLSETDTAINTRVTTLDSNMSNYLSETDTAINTRVTTLDSNMSNYLSETDTAINTRVTTLDSNMSNYLSETDTAINTRITNLTADEIADGPGQNRFIVNDVYNRDLTILGTLTTSNLNVMGDTTTITTSTYQTENMEIVSQSMDGPAIKVVQNGVMNVAEFFDGDSNVMTILNGGNVGIGSSVPTEKLDVDGNIKVTGSLNSITNEQLDYLAGVTSSVQTQLDTTDTKIDTLDSNMSNYLSDTDTAINTRVTTLDSNMSNYLSETDTAINTRVTTLDSNMSNYLSETDTAINTRVTTLDSNMSNYLSETDTAINTRVTTLDSNMSNYLSETDTAINTRVTTLDSNMSNYLSETDTAINTRVTTLDSNMSNYLSETDTAINTRVTTLDSNMSNYLSETDTAINTRVTTLDSNMSNYLSETDTAINTRVTTLDSNMSNYLSETDTAINTRITNLTADEIADGPGQNRFIVNDVYNRDLTILGTLTTSNLNVMGDTTTITTSTYQTENMEIVSQSMDGPAIKVVQNGVMNVAEFFDGDSNVMTILNGGNVGIGSSVPTEKLDVDGNIKVTGSLNSITNEQLDYLAGVTSSVQTQLDTTDTKIDTLDSNMSNYLSDTDTAINTRVTTLDSNMSNYLSETDTAINTRVTTLDSNMSNYLSETDTAINTRVTTLDSNMSNYLSETDTAINTRVTTLDSNMSNYLSETDTAINTRVTTLDSNMSNYLSETDTAINTRVTTLDSNMSNYLSETDTAINTRVTTLDSNMSNYLSETDTAINTRVTTLDSNMSNYLSETDTAINTRVTTLDSNMSNYLSETDTAINTRVTTLDSNMSNYLSETDTAINTRVTTLDSNMSNYLSETDTAINTRVTTLDSNMSNYLSETDTAINTRVTTLDSNMSNYLSETDTAINTRVTTLDSNMSNYLSETDTAINTRITNLTADEIADGPGQNRFVVNDVYNRDLTILGTLTTSNLNVMGDTTTITTSTYQTENMEIVSQSMDGPAIKVVQNGVMNVAEFFDGDSNVMTILNGGNVGIGSSVPTEKLDVDGNIKVTGSLNSITNEQLDYLAGVTSSVQTQLDTTDTKIDTLDSNMSNYLSETDTAINTRVTTLDSNMSNYLSETDTAINTRVTTLDSNMSNYLSETDTAINTRITNLDSNMSNYLSETDTVINTRITNLDSNMSNYLSETNVALTEHITSTSNTITAYINTVISEQISNTDDNLNETSNFLITTIQTLDSNMSNYLSETDTAINTRVTTLDSNMSNYLSETDTAINTRVTTLDSNMSNYLSETDTAINTRVTTLDSNMSNYLSETDTAINTLVTTLDSNMSNYLSETDTAINTRITNLTADEIADGPGQNRFIVNDVYNRDLTILGTLTTSNLNVMGDTTTITTSTYQTENMEIVSQSMDGPAIKVVQNGVMNVAEFFDGDSNVVTILNGGNVGIGSSVPTEKLDVDGNIKVTGSLNSITNEQLDFLAGVTSSVQTQLDTTDTKIDTLDSNMSNYLSETNVALTEQITSTSNTITSYLNSVISEQISNTDGNLTETSNFLITTIQTLDSNMSNYLSETDTAINTRVTTLDSNMSNYLSETDTAINTRVTTLDSNMSNYLSETDTAINTRVTTLDSNMSNFLSETDTAINTRVTELDSNMSNYLSETDTAINTRVTTLDSNMSNYLSETDTAINTRVTELDSNMSNYVDTVDTIINTRITNLTTDDITEGVHSKYVVDNIWNNNLTVTGTLTVSQLKILDFENMYESAGLNINTDLDTYIRTITSNYVNTKLDFTGCNIELLGDSQWSDSDTNIYFNTGNVGIGNNNPTEKLDVVGNIKIAGDIIPSADVTYDLGSSDNKWRDLYLSGDTIHLNNTRISADPHTKGLVVKNENNELIDVISSKLKLRNANSSAYTEIRNYNDKKMSLSLFDKNVPAITVAGTKESPTHISTSNYYYAFTTVGNNNSITFAENTVCDILVIGGGGSGGGDVGGGGGAGGVVYKTGVNLQAGTYVIEVGAGGAAVPVTSVGGVNSVSGNDGGSSKILFNSAVLSVGGTSYEGKGGGGGGNYNDGSGGAGRSGGSGGGGAPGNNVSGSGGAATQGNTNNGSAGGFAGATSAVGYTSFVAGGGGGAGAIGGTSSTKNGGTGVQISITGTSQWYAAGGGAGVINDGTSIGGNGGNGIGGNGNYVASASDNSFGLQASKHNGVSNTGSGGGGGAYNYGANQVNNGGAGGSGIVILRFSLSTVEEKLQFERWTDSDTYYDVGGRKFITYADGAVGIGTTNPGTDFKLDVLGNMRLSGTLTASNLQVVGTTTTINTATYQTENLEVITQAADGPGLKVVQNGSQDIAQFFDGTSNVFVIRDGGNVGIGSTLPQQKLDVLGNIRVAGNVVPSADVTYDLGSLTSKWKDLYLSGDTIYLNNTRISSDPTTKGLVVKDDSNNLTDIVASGVKIRNAGSSAYAEIKNVNNKVSIVTYDSAGTVVNDTDISSGTNSGTDGTGGSSQWTTSSNNIYYTLGNVGIGTSSMTNKLEIYGGDINITTGNIRKTTLGSGTVYAPVVWYQFNESPTSNIVLNDSNAVGTKYDLSITDGTFFNDTTNLKAWYRFEGNVTADSSPNNYTLTNQTAVSLDTSRFIRGTSSASFNGSHYLQRQSFDLYSLWNGNGITLSFWVYFAAPNSSTGYATLFGFANTNADATASAVFTILTLSSATAGTEATPLYFQIFNGTLNASHTTASLPLYDGNWRHIVWSISSSGTWTIYINNVSLGVSVTQGILNTLTGKFNLGRAAYLNEIRYINGNIDDFRIYNKVLTAAEVDILYKYAGPLVQKTALYTTPTYSYQNALTWSGTSSADDNVHLAYTDAANIKTLLGSFHTRKGFSIHFLFRTANLTSTSELFFLGDKSTAANTAKDLIRVHISNSTLNFRVSTGITAANYTSLKANFTYIAALTFSYVANGDMTLKMYLNGLLVDTETAAYNNLFDITTAPFKDITDANLVYRIGKYIDSDANDATPVTLQDFRVFANELTPKHVADLKTSIYNYTEPLVWYRFNDDPTTTATVTDSSSLVTNVNSYNYNLEVNNTNKAKFFNYTSSDYPLENLTDLKAWYRFSSSSVITDFSGQGNNLTNSATNVVSNSVDTIVDGSAQFGGSSFFTVSNTGNTLFTPTTFTVACWCKIVASTSSTAVKQTIVSCSALTSSVWRGWGLAVFYKGTDYDPDGHNLVFLNNNDTSLYTNFATPTTASWIHLAFTLKQAGNSGAQSIAEVYINGRKHNQVIVSYNNASPSSSLYIGDDSSGLNKLSTGSLLADFRFYSRVLSPTEVLWIYSQTFKQYYQNGGLVAWYRFDGTAAGTTLDTQDYSGNNYALTNTQATVIPKTTAAADLKKGTASAAFNGTGYLDVASAPFLVPNFTVACWCKIATGTKQTIVSCWKVNTNFFGWDINVSSGNALQFDTGVNTNTVTSSGSKFAAFAAADWKHLAVTVSIPNTAASSSATINIYVNGVSQGSFNQNIFLVSSTGASIPDKLTIGARNHTSVDQKLQTSSFIDDFRFYNRVLTPAEISQIYAPTTGYTIQRWTGYPLHTYPSAYIWDGNTATDSGGIADNNWLAYTGSAENIQNLLKIFHNQQAFTIHFLFSTTNITSAKSEILYIGKPNEEPNEEPNGIDYIRVYVNSGSLYFVVGSLSISSTTLVEGNFYTADLEFSLDSGKILTKISLYNETTSSTLTTVSSASPSVTSYSDLFNVSSATGLVYYMGKYDNKSSGENVKIDASPLTLQDFRIYPSILTSNELTFLQTTDAKNVGADLVLQTDPIIVSNDATITASGFNKISETLYYTIYSYAFTSTGSVTNTITFAQPTICDVLLVGGGGGGGQNSGGGGGGGGVIYATGINVPSGTYPVIVGAGGSGGGGTSADTDRDGKFSSVFGAKAYGGGGGGINITGSSANGRTGGSGSGAKSANHNANYVNFTGGAVGDNSAELGTILSSGIINNYKGNVGGNGVKQNNINYRYNSGGGGGAGQAGGNAYTPFPNPVTFDATKGKGGDGVQINITGTTYYWAAGGGAGGHDIPGAAGGRGGGGGSCTSGGAANNSSLGANGTDGFTVSSTGKYQTSSGSGATNTGSGGGGAGESGITSGDGGSGIVIIRFAVSKASPAQMVTADAFQVNDLVTTTIYPNYQAQRWKDSPKYYDSGDGLKHITYAGGNVGINLTAPESKLHVGSTTPVAGASTGATSYTAMTSTLTSATTAITNVCSIFDSSILVTGKVASSSDTRIKKNILDINDDSALQKILNIEPKTYDYIDNDKNPVPSGQPGQQDHTGQPGQPGHIYGFIAQQVKEVLPEAVSSQKDIIPNIYSLASVTQNASGGSTITFASAITQLAINDRVDIIDTTENRGLYTITATNPENNSITVDKQIPGSQVFVYGTQVDDFNVVDKSYIYTLNVCATQTLADKINLLKNRISSIRSPNIP
jgi:hypothetical protein